MKPKHLIVSEYMHSIYTPDIFAKLINKAAKQLKAFARKHPFDAIAFSGTSGAALAYPLSFKLNVPLICVRKQADKSHSEFLVEGCHSAKRYVIVDDFIDTGKTVKYIMKSIQLFVKGRKPQVAAIFLYNDHGADCYERNKLPVYSIKL